MQENDFSLRRVPANWTQESLTGVAGSRSVLARIMSFPVYLRVGSLAIHPHLLFEVLAYAVGFRVYLKLRRQGGDHLPDFRPLVGDCLRGHRGGARQQTALPVRGSSLVAAEHRAARAVIFRENNRRGIDRRPFRGGVCQAPHGSSDAHRRPVCLAAVRRHRDRAHRLFSDGSRGPDSGDSDHAALGREFWRRHTASSHANLRNCFSYCAGN